MRSISLTQGLVALVDDEDYDMLATHVWYAAKCDNKFYASRRDGRRPIRMHRVVIGAESREKVDHINGDGLDNRRQNLRVATTSENMHNQPKHSNNTSGYKGVTFHRQAGKWTARIRCKSASLYLGLFPTASDAARAYDFMAVQLHGPFAHLNFDA